jgi:hypothetical protein
MVSRPVPAHERDRPPAAGHARATLRRRSASAWRAARALAERAPERTLDYASAWSATLRVGNVLLELGATADRPVASSRHRHEHHPTCKCLSIPWCRCLPRQRLHVAEPRRPYAESRRIAPRERSRQTGSVGSFTEICFHSYDVENVLGVRGRARPTWPTLVLKRFNLRPIAVERTAQHLRHGMNPPSCRRASTASMGAVLIAHRLALRPQTMP